MCDVRISVVCDSMKKHKVRHFNGVVWCGVVHSTWPSQAMWHMYAPTFKKKKKKKKTLHIFTHGATRGWGLTSLVVCINDKIHDITERHVTIRSEI
jgi:hypothetical protein